MRLGTNFFFNIKAGLSRLSVICPIEGARGAKALREQEWQSRDCVLRFRKRNEATFAVIQKKSKTHRATKSRCLGASPRKGGLTVAPFGISASRNRQSPPNCPKFSGSGYVQTVALGKNCDGVRTNSTYPLQFFPETPYQR